jgi:phospholipid N-methyltransferase
MVQTVDDEQDAQFAGHTEQRLFARKYPFAHNVQARVFEQAKQLAEHTEMHVDELVSLYPLEQAPHVVPSVHTAQLAIH